ncbi:MULTISPECIES: hypothetical protein [Arthrobacter]|uniref:Uncharacterized protein n=2 Tax=Arthrobacter TaxID=1663 RepID=A0ABU9KL95_9MICC|nr:hypothetical protein [Arthrobacter sp. YJM1]MDP5227676.1 hypothetical protein [Arthrobacter sp. YJM1]
MDVLPSVEPQSGRVTLFLPDGERHFFCPQPHQLLDALARAVRRPRWSGHGNDAGTLSVRVAATGRRDGRELLFTLQALPELRSTETGFAGEPAEKPRKFALQ